MKVVINRCFGGFGLSQEALTELQKLDDKLVITYDTAMLHKETLGLVEDGISRDNLNLVSVVEKLGDAASSEYDGVEWVADDYNSMNLTNIRAILKVVEIPDDVEYTIEDYDGAEWVAEVHRTWS